MHWLQHLDKGLNKNDDDNVSIADRSWTRAKEAA